ncbi:hypothetical protein [Desulfonema magnum]|uniref:Uncharacterized protein n=1 Tax=Desulfonema magnum TaxID=45655 RepID=A0A975BTT9_9BACT|nr:hypothetical protein [Desulfonema magnum]QTA91566.1 Uncharacterized protein dnm_076360 [Desulfonema magnum]
MIYSYKTSEDKTMRQDQAMDNNIYLKGIEMQEIGNRAVLKAQEESRKLGIPNAYSRNGELYFELPSGEITKKDPFNEISFNI